EDDLHIAPLEPSYRSGRLLALSLNAVLVHRAAVAACAAIGRVTPGNDLASIVVQAVTVEVAAVALDRALTGGATDEGIGRGLTTVIAIAAIVGVTGVAGTITTAVIGRGRGALASTGNADLRLLAGEPAAAAVQAVGLRVDATVVAAGVGAIGAVSD